ncbi:hypothetical protein SYNPS1DRAFT_29244 [Syncephalis pseudoplumigaleata]|uniref:Uncharacterized protein n=1 Tax=Syncephalis pseudoplumigaleata TaxID=1712513 RepID=A0A4P9YXZ7_9FUNG|nr:hypothetical protein SYNPS1DRAFT_29244 [Syncephalis pseudoplumigaleata]|eukprot:RKP25013.1 hypothetical protein SYNPS1DRAFT_29244 [Syncephalis pseudoplumigaleata]
MFTASHHLHKHGKLPRLSPSSCSHLLVDVVAVVVVVRARFGRVDSLPLSDVALRLRSVPADASGDVIGATAMSMHVSVDAHPRPAHAPTFMSSMLSLLRWPLPPFCALQLRHKHHPSVYGHSPIYLTTWRIPLRIGGCSRTCTNIVVVVAVVAKHRLQLVERHADRARRQLTPTGTTRAKKQRRVHTSSIPTPYEHLLPCPCIQAVLT